MKAYPAKYFRSIDQYAITHLGIPEPALMENAGSALARAVLKLTARRRRCLILIICGHGNNGGDGFVAARHLMNHGCRLDVVLFGKAAKLKKTAKIHHDVLLKSGLSILQSHELTVPLKKIVLRADVVIDALFGIGINRPVGEPYLDLIRFLNNAKKKIVSADIPSGLDADTGDIKGLCIQATQTITFSALKQGFAKKWGPKVCGKIVVAEIGIPQIKTGKAKEPG